MKLSSNKRTESLNLLLQHFCSIPKHCAEHVINVLQYWHIIANSPELISEVTWSEAALIMHPSIRFDSIPFDWCSCVLRNFNSVFRRTVPVPLLLSTSAFRSSSSSSKFAETRKPLVSPRSISQYNPLSLLGETEELAHSARICSLCLSSSWCHIQPTCDCSSWNLTS